MGAYLPSGGFEGDVKIPMLRRRVWLGPSGAVELIRVRPGFSAIGLINARPLLWLPQALTPPLLLMAIEEVYSTVGFGRLGG